MSSLASRVLSLPGRLIALATCLLLTACDPLVNVDATSNVPARYSSVLVTVKAIWFNESAVAVPADATWLKFPLKKTRTIDLVELTGGEMKRIARELDVPEGSYQQVRVILASRDEELLGSADDADARYNNEVTWFDEDDDEHTSPLEVLNADQGIGIEMKLKVKKGALGNQFTTLQLLFDAARDLTEFRYSGETGFLLNPTLKAFDAEKAGTMRGTLNLSQIDIRTGTGRPDIEVTAQKLDEDLDRRVIVGSASVSRTGAFVLYPLPLDEDEDTTEYDLVIHGPGIQTIVIRDVPVSEAAPDSAAQLALGGLRPEPADSFEADISEEDPVVPRGARIGFYQTLPGEDEPYLIEVAAVDPLRGRFARAVALTRATSISYGTYGPSFTLRSGTPDEGEARYAVAALSPYYGSGALADTLLRPATQASDTRLFSVPAIGMPVSAVPGTISTTVTVENPGRYDSGMLLVTRDGAVVTAVSLDEVLLQLQASNLVDVTQVPAGTGSATLERGLYYLEAWTWNSTAPEDTFTRHPRRDPPSIFALPQRQRDPWQSSRLEQALVSAGIQHGRSRILPMEGGFPMRRLMATLALATLVLAGTTPVAAKEKQTGEQKLAALLDGRVAGEPRSCISTSRINNLQVIDRTALVYKDGDTLWVNRPLHPDSLDRDDILVMKRLSGLQLCRLDQITTMDQYSGFFTGVVFLRNFVPYRKVASDQ